MYRYSITFLTFQNFTKFVGLGKASVEYAVIIILLQTQNLLLNSNYVSIRSRFQKHLPFYQNINIKLLPTFAEFSPQNFPPTKHFTASIYHNFLEL